MSKQNKLPIFEALKNWNNKKIQSFFVPAHKGKFHPSKMHSLLTPEGMLSDLSCMADTDNIMNPQGCIEEAQSLAASLYSASNTFFLVNGSTIGVKTIILAAVSYGQKILISRYSHLSAFSGLALAGVIPVWIDCVWEENAGPIPPTSKEIEKALQADSSIKAVFLTSPTYYGVARNLRPIAKICRQYDVALIVDEAHGAHLRFLPEGNLESALDSGADLVVQSTHKTMGSLTGTAQIHINHNSRISKEEVQVKLNLLQSTSPNYLLLASLDITRHWASVHGKTSFSKTIDLLNELKENLQENGGYEFLNTQSEGLTGCKVDPMKLCLNVAPEFSGFEFERQLLERFRIYGEFCDSHNVLFIFSPLESEENLNNLQKCLLAMSKNRINSNKNPISKEIKRFTSPVSVLTPSEAIQKKTERIMWDSALGSICGEMISAYPPGIPIFCPGEKINKSGLDYLKHWKSEGAQIISGDPTINTVAIIK